MMVVGVWCTVRVRGVVRFWNTLKEQPTGFVINRMRIVRESPASCRMVPY